MKNREADEKKIHLKFNELSHDRIEANQSHKMDSTFVGTHKSLFFSVFSYVPKNY